MKVSAPQIIARTGWTTAELNEAIDQANPKGPFDLVSLLIGVNNQYREYPLDGYRTEFAVSRSSASATARRRDIARRSRRETCICE